MALSPAPRASAAEAAAPAAASPNGNSSGLRRGAVLVLKAVCLWIPAVCFWISLAWDAQLLDLRTEEELAEEENEARRLERFFDVHFLPEDEYLQEMQIKEEALSHMVDKLLKSRNFLDHIANGPLGHDHDGDDEEGDSPELSAARAPERKSAQLVAEADVVEVSYVHPPPRFEDGSGDEVSKSFDLEAGSRTWMPRLVFAHRDGGLVLVTMNFQYVLASKDREERWACTQLRAGLIAGFGGDAANEEICCLQGPLPHGVRYMRI